MNGLTYNETTLRDVIDVLEERKKSSGLYESDGMLDGGKEQAAMIYMSLDLDLEDLSETLPWLTGPLVAVVQRALSNGLPVPDALAGIYFDAFATGVMYEKMRRGEM